MDHQPHPPSHVARRRVFYIPGYDPFPPRRYRELYRRESAAQARISGYDISQKASREGGRYGWEVRSRQEGAEVEAVIEVLLWSDIVRGSMGSSILATYVQLVRTAWCYIGSGALMRLMRLRSGPVLAALYPVLALLVQLFLALAVAGCAYWAGLAALRQLAPAWAAWALLAPAALIVIYALRWFRANDNRFYAYYLMHDYAFTARWNGAYPPQLDARIEAFADRIAQALEEDWDEVLVVGHSSGAHVAISALAALERRNLPDRTPLALLTLGHVVPMVSFLPAANRLRRDLHELSASTRVTWVDVTAMGDGCTFALVDPAGVTGVAPADQTGPLVFSAAFSQSLSPERWKADRRRYFQLHFQYLCAFDRVQDYDYFRITAGPLTLAARYHSRAPSPSRIAMPVNRFRSLS